MCVHCVASLLEVAEFFNHKSFISEFGGEQFLLSNEIVVVNFFKAFGWQRTQSAKAMSGVLKFGLEQCLM